MVATLAVPTLIKAAHRVGVKLHMVNSGGNLYVWHTPMPEEAVVYIGKSASDKRLNEERVWRDGLDPTAEIVIGIVTLLRVNQAVSQALHYDPTTFDASKWRDFRDKDSWSGEGSMISTRLCPLEQTAGRASRGTSRAHRCPLWSSHRQLPVRLTMGEPNRVGA